MAGPAAEVIDLRPNQNTAVAEVYAQSMDKFRKLGALVLHSAVEVGNPGIVGEQVREDSLTGITEMVKTDPDFGQFLTVEGQRTNEVVDCQARDRDGKPVIDLVVGGSRASAALAKEDPIFAGQAERDGNDVPVARWADELNPGEGFAVITMVPKKDMQQHPDAYHKLGYRDGLSYWQYFVKTHDDKLVSGWYSIDESNEQALRDVCAEQGVDIPIDESHNGWTKHPIRFQKTPEEAKEYVVNMTENYNAKAGITGGRVSVSEFIRQNNNIIDGIFNAYHPALGEAVYTGKNNQVLKSFAHAMLETDLSEMDEDVRAQLIKVANSSRFDDEQGRVMESVIRYAIVEELRKSLPSYVQEPNSHNFLPTNALDFYSVKESSRLQHGQDFDVDSLNVLLAGNVSSGVKAGRDYGGCANVTLGKKNEFKVNAEVVNAIDAPKGALQEAFDGHGTSEEEKIGQKRKDKCVVPACPNGQKIVEVGGCGVCLERCQPIFDAGGDPTLDSAESHEDDHEASSADDHSEPSELAEVISLAERAHAKQVASVAAEAAVAHEVAA